MATQFLGDARSPVARPFQRNALDRVAQLHVVICAGLGLGIVAIEAAPAHPAQLQHALNRQPTAAVHFFPDLPVDCGFPFDACSISYSSMRCKHPSNNRSRASSGRSCALTRQSALPTSAAARDRERMGRPLAEFFAPVMQHASIYFQRPRYAAIQMPCSRRCTASNLNFRVNRLRDDPMTHFLHSMVSVS